MPSFSPGFTAAPQGSTAVFACSFSRRVRPHGEQTRSRAVTETQAAEFGWFVRVLRWESDAHTHLQLFYFSHVHPLKVQTDAFFFFFCHCLLCRPPHPAPQPHLLFLSQKRLSSCSPTECLRACEDDERATVVLVFRKDVNTLNLGMVADCAATKD